MNPGIVSADRHDRQIDGTGRAQLRKRIAQRGVAAEKDATVISFENVAVVTAIGVTPRPCAPMFCSTSLSGILVHLEVGLFNRQMIVWIMLSKQG